MPVPERRPTPIVCDLRDAPDTAEERIAEYRRLFAGRLIGRDHTGDVVTFRFAQERGVEAWVRDLAAREHRCCAFFDFTVSAEDGAVVWHATVGDGDAARAMLTEWARLPETVVGGTDAVHDRWTDRGLTFVDGTS